MAKKSSSGARVYSVTEFSWPRLHTGKCWFVDFLCYDPVEGKMRRKKYHLDGIKKLTDRRKRAAELIAKLSDKLQHGWNVWAEKAENIRQYTLYENVREFWLYRYSPWMRGRAANQISWYNGRDRKANHARP